MHSFHPSRGRIFFEVLCATAMAASLTGAWMQTGASSLLAAAAVAALYGFVHLFDMRRKKSAEPVQPPRVAAEEEPQGGLPAFAAGAQEPVAAREPAAAVPAEITQPVAPAPTPAKAARRSKAPRKGSGRRAGAAKIAEVTELARPEEKVTELAPPEKADVAPPAPSEPAYTHIEPLFEPEPFVRQQRTVFGRKAG